MTEIIPFDFEEQAVRVVMRDGEPWFVAADVCRVLEIRNTSDAVLRLDDDERDMVNLNTLGLTEGIRGNPNASIISESGLYALTVRSDKPEARRFRKWITAVVLPSIRRTGRYDHTPPQVEPQGDVFGMTFREVEAFLQLVREARLTKGTKVAAAMWARTPLPPLDAQGGATVIDPAEARACLDCLIARIRDCDPETLSTLGLRFLEGDLFVGNQCSAFHGTRWAGGAHKAHLLALPGVELDATRTLAGARMRGVLIPSDLLTMEGCDA